MKKITIIGAGIGGLTAAIALQQKGFEVEVFESTPAFKKAGSGINLAINAMQVLKRLGLYDQILENASHTKSMNLRTKDLDPLSNMALDKFEAEFGVKSLAIHRASLHQVLHDHLGDTKVHLNKKLVSLSQEAGVVNLTFSDGTQHSAGVVIGADGIHSAVRKSIFPDSELRDAKQVCWRGISSSKIDQKHRGELNELWGKGKRFGFVHIAKDEIYWFGLINKNRFSENNADLLEIFSDFHPIILDLINGTPKQNILRNELWDLKPIPKWYEGNVCLLGDACHATTPNMGQGAVQAIESAMALSLCLAGEDNAEKAFMRYQKIRKEKADQITNTSWRVGKIAQLDNRLLTGFRNLMMKMTPSSMMDKTNRKVFELNF